VHTACFCGSLDGFLGLTFSSYKYNILSGCNNLRQKLLTNQHPFQCLFDIDNMDVSSLREDIGLHLGIPTANAVAEMNARVNQISYQLFSHKYSPTFFNIVG